MNAAIQMHDVVALLDEVPVKHFETGQPLVLRRGQIGTVLMTYDGTAFEVELESRDGRTCAMLPIPAGNLMVLHETPLVAAA
jgi:hypothetical protein